MTRVSLTILTAGAMVLAASQAFAISAEDQTFADAAASGGLAEVQLGRLAQQRGSLDQTKQFGAQMVTDHSKANQQLQQIASQQNIKLPTEPTSAQALTYTQLEALKGLAFDKRYAEVMISDHQDTIATFENQASAGQDPQLKTFAQSTLPTLQHHLQMAVDLNRASLNRTNASLLGSDIQQKEGSRP